jgi:hypothetical protein
MLSLTELVDRVIAIEDGLLEGGCTRDAAELRAAWNHAPTAALPQLLDDYAPVAARARAHPRRFVIPAGEPLALAQTGETMFSADPEAVLNPAAIAGCQESRLRARLVHRAQKGGGIQ